MPLPSPPLPSLTVLPPSSPPLSLSHPISPTSMAPSYCPLLTVLPPPPPHQPFCSEGTNFHGLTVEMLFDSQQTADAVISIMVHNDMANALIRDLHVCVRREAGGEQHSAGGWGRKAGGGAQPGSSVSACLGERVKRTYALIWKPSPADCLGPCLPPRTLSASPLPCLCATLTPLNIHTCAQH